MANFHAGHELSDEKQALDEIFLQMRLPTGELRRFCINQYLNYVAKRDFWPGDNVICHGQKFQTC